MSLEGYCILCLISSQKYELNRLFAALFEFVICQIEALSQILPHRRKTTMKKRLILGSVLVLLLPLAYLLLSKISQHTAQYKESDGVADTDSMKIFTPPPPQMLYGINIDSMGVEQGFIQRNENLSEILEPYNISVQTVHEISRLPKGSFDVRRLQSRKPYTIIHEKDSLKTARAFIYHPNKIDYTMLKFDDHVKVYKGQNQVDTIEEVSTRVIETSLYNAIVESNGSPLLVNRLADVYAWEIDFFGLQKGDAFKVIYKRYEVNGEDAGLGEIISCWFQHEDKAYYAVRYDQGDGPEYFDKEGRSLRKTFLKAPLNFSRISSGFSYSRLHPILKIRRPHTGVDYAAPRGTPVVAVGDGEVILAAYKGGGGNTVKIKHNANYTTAYLHLSGYGKAIKRGVKVKQGQVIGYVGSTGLSTGPHLDFRFWKNGKPVDPLKIDPPSANPIGEAHKKPYHKHMLKAVHELDSIKIPNLAPLL
jgi:murein DD-endopeptidase MepM/ murein hydrolase activator NlpD